MYRGFYAEPSISFRCKITYKLLKKCCSTAQIYVAQRLKDIFMRLANITSPLTDRKHNKMNINYIELFADAEPRENVSQQVRGGDVACEER